MLLFEQIVKKYQSNSHPYVEKIEEHQDLFPQLFGGFQMDK